MKVSSVVGKLGTKFTLFRTNKAGEKIMEGRLYIGEIKLPILVSEFILENQTGWVEVKGYMETTRSRIETDDETKIKRRPLFTYFRALDIVQLPEEGKYCNTVYVDVVVRKKPEWNVSDGVETLKFIADEETSRGRLSTMHVCAYKGMARRLRSINVGQRIVGKGYIKCDNSSFKIQMAEVEEVLTC